MFSFNIVCIAVSQYLISPRCLLCWLANIVSVSFKCEGRYKLFALAIEWKVNKNEMEWILILIESDCTWWHVCAFLIIFSRVEYENWSHPLRRNIYLQILGNSRRYKAQCLFKNWETTFILILNFFLSQK